METEKPDQEQYFNGKVLLSWRGCYMCTTLVIVCCLISGITALSGLPRILSLLCYMAAIPVTVFCFAGQFNYFSITSQHLNIHNSVYFWWRRSIPFSDIKSARIDMDILKRRNISSYYLHIFFNDLRSKKFFAAPLRRKTWAALTTELEQHNISVIDAHPPEVHFKDLL